ncbi:MAG: hypothetical protein CVU48_02085 [Candidatus Cloacimonetes bacterium HGW-Cloacimonetes-1]|nr:MAG: hypothetical protein CVU48_02085 [Candidatus Cloacimonetes bacterium HGW-Cloacimonetes-1]
MLRKSIILLFVAAIMVGTMFLTTGCGKSGNRFDNHAPTIKITSYEGIDTTSTVYNSPDTLSYQQRIYWHADDTDGVITGYAYRVLDENGNPISTPGNRYIDTDGSVTPSEVLNMPGLGSGWVVHYKAGADQSVPLSSPQARKTIWTSNKYALINFPASDANGNPAIRMSRFEVIAIDNRNQVTEHAAFRLFKTESEKPTCSVQTTKGDPQGKQVGTAIRLSFTMIDYDPFITSAPWYFKFKINKRQGIYTAPDTGAVYNDNQYPVISSTQWYVTTNLANISQFLLTQHTDPSITSDYVNGVQVTHTEVVARAYDTAGIVSDTLKYNANGAIIGKTSVRFAVYEGFNPQTVIYGQKTYALGDNHFVDYSDDAIPEVLPFTLVNGGQRFATPFFVDLTQKNTAVHSDNAKVWIRWGWWGEYARVQSNGDNIPTLDPYEKKVDAVLDETTNRNYYAEITHFDLRLDGQPYNFPPLADQVVTDLDGKRWLRIPFSSPLGQTVVLTTLAIGTHSFEVRAVDLQGVVDPTPAEFTFDLVAPVPKAQRQGILIIDDDTNSLSTSPDEIVLQKYTDALASYSGTKTFITRSTAQNPGQTFEDIRKRHLALSDLQNYRLVIHHSDNVASSTTLNKDHDGLALYLHTGGNLLISGTHLHTTIYDAMVAATQRTFVTSMGLGYSLSNTSSLTPSGIQNNTFFQKATGQAGYGDVYVQFQDNNDLAHYPTAGFNSIVNSRKGLSAITYFNAYSGDVIYRLGCKPVSYPSYAPTQAQYDQFNGKPVAIKKVNTNNTNYLFGFPLSYMEIESMKAMFAKIITEVM